MLENLDTAQITQYLITYGTKAIGFLVLLFIVFRIAAWAKKLSFRAMQKSKIDEALANFGSSILKYIVVIAGVVSCLGIFGIQTVSFAAVLAAAGFAVGMALQGTLGNFASGVMLIVFKPVKVGDYVEVAGTAGTVKEVEIFSTSLDTPDNVRIIVPNAQVFGQQIKNYSFHSLRRVDVNVGTEYPADVDKTRSVLMEAMKSIPQGLKDPEPAVVLTNLGASSIDWALRLWVKAEDYWAVKDALTRAAKYTLEKEKIGIPYQTVDVNIGGEFPLNIGKAMENSNSKTVQ